MKPVNPNDKSNLTTVSFTGCAYLDFNPTYAAKRQATSMGLFWLRDTSPQMVQFCKKRGRIYGCKACLSEENRHCDSYDEITHEITLPVEELES